MRLSGGGFLQELADNDLSLTQLKALHVLDETGEISIKQLGESLQLSMPATSRAVEGLVQRGLVSRSECATDRRCKLLDLSADGRAALERVSRARLAGFARFAETLEDAERDALLAAVRPIVERSAR